MIYRVCALVMALSLAACGGSEAPTPTATPAAIATATEAASPTAAPSPTTTPTPPLSATATVEVAELPDTPVGRRLSWVLDALLTDPEALAPDDIADAFTDDFLAEVPAPDLLAGVANFRLAYGLPRFERFSTPPSDTEAAVTLSTGSGSEFILTVAVEPVEPHRISGLLIGPDQGSQPTQVPAEDWAAFDARLSGSAAWVNFLAAEVVDGACLPVHAVDPARPLAIGSAFKLYVLGELAHQVSQGSVAWDDELVVQEDLKSLPSGTMQDEPAGTTHTLRYFAEQMISISDNTATDHLLFSLGRENVEAYQAALGHSDPLLNQPFVSTREMFTIKLVLTGENARAYAAADTAERRRQLAEEIGPLDVTLDRATGWAKPRYIDTIEWFASAEDLCRAMAGLKTLAEQPGLEPIGDILSINPGVAFDPQVWTYIGYKGGSEPGVLNLTWLLQRADGRWFVLTAGLNDPDHTIDLNGAITLLQSAALLLAEE